MIFTQATLQKGIEIVIEYTELQQKLEQADFVFTGEGGIDFQTKFGKTPYGVARTAKASGKKSSLWPGISARESRRSTPKGSTPSSASFPALRAWRSCWLTAPPMSSGPVRISPGC